MIRAWFGIENDPFTLDNTVLLGQQQEIFDTIKVHSQQGGLRARTKTINLDIVNKVLVQPHWRNEYDMEAV
jgi:hypothetical protein